MIYLGLGSNLGTSLEEKYANLNRCLKLIQFSRIKILKCSKIFVTPSYPNKTFPSFLNLVIQINFKSKAQALIKILKLIERKMGRIKTIKNGPRIIDIDILDFNKEIIDDPNLNIPHPRMHSRNFVLFPLKELNANWQHPKTGVNISKLVADLPVSQRNEITKFSKSAILD